MATISAKASSVTLVTSYKRGNQLIIKILNYNNFIYAQLVSLPPCLCTFELTDNYDWLKCTLCTAFEANLEPHYPRPLVEGSDQLWNVSPALWVKFQPLI